VHLGHKKIIDAVTAAARKGKLDSLIITFDRHPRLVLKKPFTGSITTLEDKKEIFAQTGVKHVWFLKADSGVLNYSAHDFLSLVKKYFDLKVLIVGDDFRFGKDALHGAHNLDKLAKEFGFKTRVIKKMLLSGKAVSSTYIRELIQPGDITAANKFLGRAYSFKGVVVTGRGNGRKLGFPTANIRAGEHIIPANGVYAGKCRVGKKVYPAAINIGTNPTVTCADKLTIEAHILNFKKNITGRKVELFFLKRLRSEKKFPSRNALIAAIARDVEYIRKFHLS
jgi:riboflavin kinase/FMN adenylyltransferase